MADKSVPTWKGTALDSPVTKVAIPLFGMYRGEGYQAGTGCMIGPWLALTARHVIEGFFQHFGQPVPQDGEDHDVWIYTYVLPGGDEPIIQLVVHRIFYSPPMDVAVLWLRPAGEFNQDRVWEVPRLELLPPKVGEHIAGFGYPNTRILATELQHYEVHMDATTTTGNVVEIHHELRDAAMLPFPCFRTDARFDPGMSGGPVFNEAGHLCGIICSSLQPEMPDGEHISYASTLWPALGTMINAGWSDRYPPDTYYPLYEYAEAHIIDALHLDAVSLTRNADGLATVGCRYKAAEWDAHTEHEPARSQ